MPEARSHPQCTINGIYSLNDNPTHPQHPEDQTITVKINMNGHEMEKTVIADPHSCYTILNVCPDKTLLGEDIEIALKNGKKKANGKLITQPISINGQTSAGQIIYVPTFPKTIIGWKELYDLGLMQANMPRDFVIDVPPVLIKGNTDPGKFHQGYLKKDLLSDASKVISSWQRKGLIERCNSICNAPISLGIKANGKVNIKFYYGDLNDCSEKEPCHPQVHTSKAIEAITLGKYYTVFKLFYGEWQIPLDTYTKYKTAFTFLGKQYVWNRLPGQFQNKTHRLSEALEKVLDQLPEKMRKRVTYYIDVILISAETMEECKTFTDKLWHHLVDNSFQIRQQKYQCLPKVTFLGREISEDGVRLGSECLKNITQPRDEMELRSIFNRLKIAIQYTPGFSIFRESLSNYLAGKKRFHWDDKCQAVLNGLKNQLLLNRPVIPGLAENEACIVQIFVKDLAWMAQISNRAGKPYRFGSGLFPPLIKEDSFAIQELKAMKEIWEIYKRVLENRAVEWEVESPDIVRYKKDPNSVPHEKRFKLDVLKSHTCTIKVVSPGAREPPIPWPEIL